MVVQFIVFLTLPTLICRGTDISKYFSESLGIRDNESRLTASLCRCRQIWRLAFIEAEKSVANYFIGEKENVQIRNDKQKDAISHLQNTTSHTGTQPASVAQLDAPSDWRPGGRGFNPRRGRQHSFVEIDHEIFSTVILSLPLIQEGQLSVSGERMCTILVNRLEV